MKRTLLSLAVAMFTVAPLAPAIAQVPTQSTTLQSVVPKGWKVESTINGDLNGDRQSDAVLRLIHSNGDRALVVSQKQSNGQWRRIDFAPRLLLCSTCGGMLGSIEIKIENGVILVQQLRGSREAVETLHRFWIDKASNRVVLIGQDVRVFDRATGAETRESSNLLTGQKITETYRANQQRTGIELVSQWRSSIPRTLKAIETVNIEETRL